MKRCLAQSLAFPISCLCLDLSCMLLIKLVLCIFKYHFVENLCYCMLLVFLIPVPCFASPAFGALSQTPLLLHLEVPISISAVSSFFFLLHASFFGFE